MNSTKPLLRRALAVGFKLAIVLVLAWGVHRTVAGALGDLEEHQWSPAELRPGWLFASGVLYLLSLLPSGLFWRRVLTALGQEPQLGETLRAYYIGHLGKYIPGKAMVIVLRTGLIRSTRVDTAVAVVSIFYETLTMMAVGAALASLLLAVWFRHELWLVAVAVGMALAAGVPILPGVFRRIVTIVGRSKVNAAAVERIGQLNLRELAGGWLSIASGWLLNGVSLWATLVAARFASEPATVDDLLICTAAGALAVVAGFLSLIPGGAMVREMVLIALLSPRYGEAAAVVSAIVARLVSLVAELGISAILYFAGPRRPQPSHL
ncbi:MAG TPA: lysylphosphatidylglycerol synthase domain-containing protein [Pirellulales bacterium]|nr:lysylphosphatidylglycerol synthase domain-containing protein [Pirellulales bacterium]